LLHVADVHLEKSFRWLGPERGDRRRQELRDAFQRAVTLALQQRVDALCIAGDLYDADNAGPAVGEFLASALATLGSIPVLIAPGNHDSFRPGGLYDRVDWSPNVRIFRSRTLEPERIADGVVWGRAFTAGQDHEPPLAGARATGTGPHVGLLHGDVVAAGATSIYGPIDPADIAASGLGFLLLGHVHNGQIDETRRFAYPGSVEPLDLSESGERWALLHTIGSGGTTVERLSLARRRVIADVIDLSGVATIADLRRLVEARSDSWIGNDVRLTLSGELRGELALRPSAIDDVLGPFDVESTLTARAPIDFDALATQHSTLGAYVRRLRQEIANASNDEAQRKLQDILDAGVAAFMNAEVVLR
jgi:DNA repair exonuclease SbcCD nuclease subunit